MGRPLRSCPSACLAFSSLGPRWGDTRHRRHGSLVPKHSPESISPFTALPSCTLAPLYYTFVLIPFSSSPPGLIFC